jgi:hypothetical protein
MLPAKAASANPEDFLSLQLKSAEGRGLDATDIAQTTKLVFYVPTDIHQLAFATVGFVHLVEIIFGTQSVLYWAIHSWTMHMQLNQLAYEEGFSVDAMFGAKILTLTDVYRTTSRKDMTPRPAEWPKPICHSRSLKMRLKADKRSSSPQTDWQHPSTQRQPTSREPDASSLVTGIRRSFAVSSVECT